MFGIPTGIKEEKIKTIREIKRRFQEKVV